jgi:hypothetical protein
MFALVLSAFLLTMTTIWLHAGGIALVGRPLTRIHDPKVPRSFMNVVLILHRMILWMILLHVAEITVWALFYWWQGCFPSARESFYFSGVTYTTVGYGDVVLASPWRLLAPIESLMGELMCGLSTGFFFYVVSRIHNLRLMEEKVASTEQKKEL